VQAARRFFLSSDPQSVINADHPAAAAVWLHSALSCRQLPIQLLSLVWAARASRHYEYFIIFSHHPANCFIISRFLLRAGLCVMIRRGRD
jgi:hypothetical protein